MAYEVTSHGETEVQVKVRIPRSRIQEAVEQELSRLGSQVRIKGFRPGKVPRQVLRKRYGDSVTEDVRRHLLEQELGEAVREHKLRPVQAPRLEPGDLEPGADGTLEVSFDLECVPTIEVRDYKGLKVAMPPLPFQEESVEQEIERLRQELAQLEPAGEGPAAAGDMLRAHLRYQFLDGTSLPPMENRLIDTRLGSVDGVRCEAAIGRFVGAAPGDQVKLTLELPDDFPIEDHRGKTAVVACDLQEIRRVRLPELDDPEFLQKFQVDSSAALRDKVRQRLQSQAQAQQDRLIEDLCVDRLLERHPFPLPGKLLERAARAEEERLRKDLGERGLAAAEIERQILEVTSRLQQQTERRLRETFLLDRIAELEDLQVQEQELQAHFQLMAQALRTPAQQLLDHFVETGQVERVVDGLRRDKVRRFLRSSAETTDRESERPPLAAGAPSPEESS